MLNICKTRPPKSLPNRVKYSGIVRRKLIHKIIKHFVYYAGYIFASWEQVRVIWKECVSWGTVSIRFECRQVCRTLSFPSFPFFKEISFFLFSSSSSSSSSFFFLLLLLFLPPFLKRKQTIFFSFYIPISVPTPW